MAHPIWTDEKLRGLETAQLKVLRTNAAAKGATDIAEACDHEIARRAPATAAKKAPAGRVLRAAAAPVKARANTGAVRNYHFVVSDDAGVTVNPDGTFWSGSWVVAENVLKQNMVDGVKLALHRAQDELSYRQGKVIRYRKVDGMATDRADYRIDFLVENDPETMSWRAAAPGK